MVSDLATGNLTREQFRAIAQDALQDLESAGIDIEDEQTAAEAEVNAIEQENILPEEPLAEEPFVDVHVDEPVDALNQEELMRQTLDPHYD